MSEQESAANPQYITLWRRLAVIIYDGLLLFAVLFFAAIPFSVAFNITYDSPLYPIFVAYLYGVAFLYYGWFWTRGQTLAMKTWRVGIETNEGHRLSWKQAFVRYVAAMISWLIVGLGFYWSLFHKQKATWHDLASSTRLVKRD